MSKKSKKYKKLQRYQLVLLVGVIIVLLAIIFYALLTKDNSLSQARAENPQPLGQSSGWNLLFTDEFDGVALDNTKWVTCYAYSSTDDGCGHSNNEIEWYLPKNVQVNNGTAKLIAKKETYNAPDGKTYNYTSGMITTGRNKGDTSLPAKFKYQYGYVEMRAKVPAGKGLWPAFWMIPFSDTDPYKWPPELDIMEIVGHEPTISYMNFYWNDANGILKNQGGSYAGPNYSQDWHTYAVDWEPEAIRWYIDGVERVSHTDKASIPAEPMHIIANLAVGGNWPGEPDTTTVFPSSFEIDYIRVWQKTQPTPTNLVTQTNQPTPTPTPTAIPTQQQAPISMLQNGSFETGTVPWYLKKTSPAAATMTKTTTTAVQGLSSLKVDITNASKSDWYIQLYQGGLKLTKGKTYTFSFWAKASKNRPVTYLLQQNTEPYKEYLSKTANLTTSWQQFTETYRATDSNSNVAFEFNMAKTTGTVYIDHVSLLSN